MTHESEPRGAAWLDSHPDSTEPERTRPRRPRGEQHPAVTAAIWLACAAGVAIGWQVLHAMGVAL